MKYDLKTPCRNCPFRTDDTAIRFACRERAAEIEEQAYRRGFPCHLSAEHIEDEDTFDGESGGFYPGENTQHCAGALIMYCRSDMGPWPGINNDDDLYERLCKRLDFEAPVFDGEDEFIEANAEEAALDVYEREMDQW